MSTSAAVASRSLEDPTEVRASGGAAPASDAALRVLFISYHFPPAAVSGSLRAARFAQRLPPDIAMEVLTLANPVEPARDTLLLQAIGERVRVHTAPERGWRRAWAGSPEHGASLAARAATRAVEAFMRHFVWIPDRAVAWLPAARRRAAALLAERRFDLLFCSSPPHSAQLIARDLKRSFGIPLVVDLRDPWTDVQLASWRQRRFDTPVHRWLERRMERSVLRAADAVIANTPSNRRMLLASFPELEPARVHVIPNGYDPSRREAIELARRAPEPLATPGATRRRLLYNGMLYDGSERWLEALRLLLARDPSLPERVEIHLVGSLGPTAARAAAPLEQAGLLRCRPRVPWHEVPAELAAADALLYAVPAGNTHWIPSKLYDYLVASKPILAVAPRGDAWEILEGSGLATLVEDTGVEDVARGMAAFLAALGAGSVRIDPQPAWIARFDGAAQAQQLAALLRGVAARA